MDVRLHVAALALDGLNLRRPETLGPALETALTRLITDRGVPAPWRTGGELTPPPLTVTTEPGVTAETLAERLALALYEGLGG